MHLVYVMTEKKCPNCGALYDSQLNYCLICGLRVCYWDDLAAKMGELEQFQNNIWTGYEIDAAKFKAQRFNPYFGDTEKQKLQEENEQLKHRAAQAEVSNNILGNTCEELRINVESWMTENQQLKAELDDCLNLELQNEIDQLEAEFANTKENYGQDD